jgi:DNA-binding CsgD family transcriptional regulator
MPNNFFSKNRIIILYSLAFAALLFLLKWLEWRFLIVNYTLELYVGAVAFLFTGVGVWLARQLARPKLKTIVVEKEVLVNQSPGFTFNQTAMAALNLSKRELEVLTLMATGLTNQQIADELFVSLNTIKTHSSKIFEKLEVQRRTQAVDKAKKIGIIP